ncbi:MAG: MoaD/ThiS family protein [Firmicutes bacterium]|nr:MoaD/ThiS family protein [Bacillota bacterium]
MDQVEVRGFGELKKIFDERHWDFPLLYDLPEETTAGELAGKLNIPHDRIEIVFVNGKAQGLTHPVRPGDRVAFVPPGTPGPYRVILGFVQKKDER